MMKLKKKHIRLLKLPIYWLEFILAWPLIQLLRLLPFKWISHLGGMLGSFVGIFCRRHVARTNLRWAFPDISESEINQILKGMYDNFGRTFLEFLQLDKINPEKMGITITFHGKEWLELAKNSDHPAILFSGHYGNWELGPWITQQHGLPLIPIYRHLNNPYLDRLMREMRQKVSPQVILKGKNAGKECLRCLKKKQTLVMLADQKMNEGVYIPFFGRPAHTPVGIAKLALATKALIIPARLKRIDQTNFEFTLYPPLEIPQSQDPATDIMVQINQILEQWIKECPEQWLWAHHRWKKEDYYL